MKYGLFNMKCRPGRKRASFSIALAGAAFVLLAALALFMIYEEVNAQDLFTPASPDNLKDMPVSNIVFSWTPLQDVVIYEILIGNDAEFNQLIVRENVHTTAYEYKGTLKSATWYFWKVHAISPAESDWSPIFIFRTRDVEPVEPVEQIQYTESPAIPGRVWICIFLMITLLILIIIYVKRTRRQH